MADIIKDSYDEANRFTKVIFQRAKDVAEFELNELQDIQRVNLYRAFQDGIVAELNPGSNDDGYKIVGTGASNEVTVKAGTIFLDGIPVRLEADTTLTGFTTYGGGGSRIDRVYIQIAEQEVADPEQVPQLGETSRRRQLSVTLGIVAGAAIPASSTDEIWEGGTRYFEIAQITRATGVAAIAAGDVTDTRYRLPAFVLDQITYQSGQTGDPIITGVWECTVGDGVNSFGDFNTSGGVNGIRQALNFVNSAGFGGADVDIVIHVKAGVYEVTGSSDNLPIETRVRLCGASGAEIQNNSNGAVPTIDVNVNVGIELEHIGLVGDIPSSIGVQDAIGVIAKDCVFTNQRILTTILEPNRSVMNSFERCVFTRDSTPDNSNAMITLSTSSRSKLPYLTTYPSKSLIMRDCAVFCGDDHAVVELAAGTPSSGTPTIEGVLFERCYIALGSTSAGGAATSTNNPGVFKFSLNTANYTFDSLDFIDCDVLANARSGANSVLLHIAMGLSNNPINRVRISGGRWLCKGGVNTATLPLYIGRTTFPTTSLVSGFAEAAYELIVENVCFGWDSASTTGVTYGTYPTSVNVDAPVTKKRAAFTFSGDHVRMENVRFTGLSNESNEGDLMVIANNIDVSKLTFERPYRTGAGGAYPHFRMKFGYLEKAKAPRGANIERIGFTESTSSGQQYVSADASARLGSIVDIYDLSEFIGSDSKCQSIISRCDFRFITFPVGTGFVIGMDDNVYADQGTTRELFLTISQCAFTQITGATPLLFSAAQSSGRFGCLRIQENNISWISGVGVDAIGVALHATTEGRVYIQSNNVRSVGDDGIVVQGMDHTGHLVHIENNTVVSSITTVPMRLGRTAAADLYGVVMGNFCGEAGRIQLVGNVNANVYIRGMQPSGAPAGWTTIPIMAGGVVDGTALLHNVGVWGSP